MAKHTPSTTIRNATHAVERTGRRVVQIMPAQPGWSAMYADAAGTIARIPLVAWAVVRETVSAEHRPYLGRFIDSVVPYDYSGERCAAGDPNENADFLGLDYPGCEIDWTAAAQQWAADRKVGRRG